MPKFKFKRKSGIVDARQLFANMGSAEALRPYINDHGEPEVLVHTGGDPNDLSNYQRQLVNNATLRYDEWRRLDDVVLQLSRKKIVGFDDLRAKGLVYNLENAMGTTVLTWEKMSDAMEAVLSIDPVRKGNGDLPDHTSVHLPIPVSHADFFLSERKLMESRNRGNALDTIGAALATRKVMEQQESMLFGTTNPLSYGGGKIYTYLTHPDVNENLYTSAGEHWDEASVTGEDILIDVQDLIQDLINNNKVGPFFMYIPRNYQIKLGSDFKAESDKTIRQRLLELEELEAIKVAPYLPDDVVVLVDMNVDTVDLVDGMPMQTVQWGTEGGFVHNFKVMAIAVPRIKSDYDGQCGIATLTPTSYKSAS